MGSSCLSKIGKGQTIIYVHETFIVSTSCSLQSRNGFNWFSYFVFLYNAIVGFVGAIIRVLLSLVYGTLLLFSQFTLDQNIMMEGFQFADEGM